MALAVNTYSKRFYPDRNTDYKPNEVIHINITPEECAMLNGKDSYLRCTVKLDCGQLAKLDPFAGGHSLIDYIQIYSGDGSALLEELTQYSMWNGIHMYYNSSEGLRNKRALLEGQDQDTVRPSIRNAYSMYYTTPTGSSGVTAENFREVELCLPFYQSGVLYGDKSFPVISTQGLQIRIYLNAAERAIVFPNVPGLGVKRDRTAGPLAITDLAYTAAFNQPAGLPDDNLNGPIGRAFGLQAALTAGNITSLDVETLASGVTIPTLVPADVANNVACTMQNTGAAAATYCGITAGMGLMVVQDSGVIQDLGLITNVQRNANACRFTFASVTVTACAIGNPVIAYIPTNDAAVDYTVSNVEFFASCTEPDEGFYAAMEKSMSQEGGMSFDIMSFNVTRNNLQKSSTVQDELLALTARRSRAILQATFVPIASPFRSYFRPIADFLKSYQYVIHDMRVPQLAVDTDREFTLGITGFNPLADDERLKTLESSKIDVKNETEPANCFVFGRRLATRGHSFNANDDHVRTTVSYGINRSVGGQNRLVVAQSDKLLVTFCRHFRKISCTPTVVNVEY